MSKHELLKHVSLQRWVGKHGSGPRHRDCVQGRHVCGCGLLLATFIVVACVGGTAGAALAAEDVAVDAASVASASDAEDNRTERAAEQAALGRLSAPPARAGAGVPEKNTPAKAQAPAARHPTVAPAHAPAAARAKPKPATVVKPDVEKIRRTAFSSEQRG